MDKNAFLHEVMERIYQAEYDAGYNDAMAECWLRYTPDSKEQMETVSYYRNEAQCDRAAWSAIDNLARKMLGPDYDSWDNLTEAGFDGETLIRYARAHDNGYNAGSETFHRDDEPLYGTKAQVKQS